MSKYDRCAIIGIISCKRCADDLAGGAPHAAAASRALRRVPGPSWATSRAPAFADIVILGARIDLNCVYALPTSHQLCTVLRSRD